MHVTWDSGKSFSKAEIAALGSLVAMAVLAVLIAPDEAAASGFCTWFIECNNQTGECVIGSYQCSQSQGDCEAICDQETALCHFDCEEQGGSPAECTHVCRRVELECNRNCVPSV